MAAFDDVDGSWDEVLHAVLGAHGQVPQAAVAAVGGAGALRYLSGSAALRSIFVRRLAAALAPRATAACGSRAARATQIGWPAVRARAAWGS